MTIQINMKFILLNTREMAEDIDVRLNISKALNVLMDSRKLDSKQRDNNWFLRTKTEDGFYTDIKLGSDPIRQILSVQRQVRWYGYKHITIWSPR